MKNDFEIRGDTTAIIIRRRNGEVYEALIDTEDLPLVMKERSWRISPKENGFYCKAHRLTKGKKQENIYLHHLVYGKPPEGMEIDHINGNPLDNRKSNLRFVTHQENLLNLQKLNRNNTTGYPGVVKYGNRYRGQFWFDGRNYSAGYFATPEEAYIARERLRKKVISQHLPPRKELSTK